MGPKQLNSLSRLIAGLAGHVNVTAFDIGARGGAKDDLARIAPIVDYYLFEPDESAAEKLRALPAAGWRSSNVIARALGTQSGSFLLNLYRQRGCSSKFVADRELADLYSRGDYYILDGTTEVEVRPLDELVSEGVVPSPDFMKIDVQGMENEVFDGADRALKETIVGVRAEVGFCQLYKDQPLFAEVDQKLRRYGLVPMRWIELHQWRRTTRLKYPQTARGHLPASYGQLIHGDVLYLLHPESLPHATLEDRKKLVRLGLVAMVYGHFDHAEAAFSRPGVAELVMETAGLDPRLVVAAHSRRFARQARLDDGLRRLGNWLSRNLRRDW